MTSVPSRPRPPRDEGTLLVLCMVLVVVCAFVVIPIMEFGIGVSRANQVATSRAVSTEAVKGGLRTALANPKALYRACGNATEASPVALAEPGLVTSVSSSCAKVGQAQAPDSGRYATAATMAGALLPAEATRKFPGSGALDPTAWHTVGNASVTPVANTIWLPALPTRLATVRQPTGWAMPTVFGACTVFFPGTYDQPVSLTGPGSVYFASGVYSFTNTVTISGDVDVVIGDGIVQGCANDYEAATYALDRPAQHGITGRGATFILGGAGRLSISSPLAGGSLRVQFNQRYVKSGDLDNDSSAGISIMSVNGVKGAGDTWLDLDVPGVLSVPKSTLQGVQSNVLVPSTLVAQNPLPAGTAILDIDVSGAQEAEIEMAGYVVVPQGALSLKAAAPTRTSKSVRFAAGVTAAMFDLSTDRPGTFVLGIVNPIVQKTFKIVSTATSGPLVTSTAVVIVNQNGAYAITSWTVQ